MKLKGLGARQTTHNLIKEMIEEKWLNVEELNSQEHLLSVNMLLDRRKIEESLLKSQIRKY